MSIDCKLCGKRRARRHCPGVDADICAQCCGTGREVTIECPLDCLFLREARVHDRHAPLTEKDIPHFDIELKQDFVEKHEREVMALNLAMARAMEREKAVDLDAREAIESLVKTYRTIKQEPLQNPRAAGIQERLTAAIEELKKEGEPGVLETLVFLQRLEIQHSNGRPRGKAFFDFLRTYFPEPAPSVEA